MQRPFVWLLLVVASLVCLCCADESHAGELFVNTASNVFLPDSDQDPLDSHGGNGRNLLIRYHNVPKPPADGQRVSVDVVLYLHGFSSRKDEAMTISAANISGVEFDRRQRPSVGIIPRGRNTEGRRYDFPAVFAKPDGVEKLVDYSLRTLTAALDASMRGGTAFAIDRLILEASSAGGNAIMRLLAFPGNDPHEIHFFDATYADTAAAKDWVQRRMARDRARLAEIERQLAAQSGDAIAKAKDKYMREEGGAYRNFYIPGTGTEKNSLKVGSVLPADPSDYLWSFYRDTLTQVAHAEIPRFFGPSILADVATVFDDDTHRIMELAGKTLRGENKKNTNKNAAAKSTKTSDNKKKPKKTVVQQSVIQTLLPPEYAMVGGSSLIAIGIAFLLTARKLHGGIHKILEKSM